MKTFKPNDNKIMNNKNELNKKLTIESEESSNANKSKRQRMESNDSELKDSTNVLTITSANSPNPSYLLINVRMRKVN